MIYKTLQRKLKIEQHKIKGELRCSRMKGYSEVIFERPKSIFIQDCIIQQMNLKL
jgi:hypothetical protein